MVHANYHMYKYFITNATNVYIYIHIYTYIHTYIYIYIYISYHIYLLVELMVSLVPVVTEFLALDCGTNISASSDRTLQMG